MKRILIFFSIVFAMTIIAYASVADYLILHDIGTFKIDKLQKHLPGEPPSGGPSTYQLAELKGSHHFQDHIDTVYKVTYLGASEGLAAPTVYVTQHVGGESDRWLLHELELPLESGDKGEFGKRSKSAILRKIGNNAILWYAGRNGEYSWVSDKITVSIEYGHMNGADIRTEPTEIVKAYLSKYPSTIPIDYPFNKSSHDDERAMTEVTRRLWLCDRWLSQIRPNEDLKLHNKLDNAIDNIKVIINYRVKYYRDISRDEAAKEEYILSELLRNNDEKGIRSNLATYSSWWKSKNR
jgi:hypothetical protein